MTRARTAATTSARTATRTARLLATLGVLPFCTGGGTGGPTFDPAADEPAARTPPPTVARPDPAAFLADARAGTRRYRSQQAAIDDGFTRVGTEFPAMGEHWVSFARVLEDSLDAGRPSILIYVTADGGPRLAGVAYTELVEGRDLAPTFPSADAWHEHNGAVDEESLPIRHSGAAHAAGARPGAAEVAAPRVFVMHAWVWTSNPDGVFATDNWGLPFARRGVALADTLPHEVARGVVRALALADDHGGYHRMVLRSTLGLGGRDDSIVGELLARHQQRAARAAPSIPAIGPLTASQSGRLVGEWESLWSDLEAALPARAADLRRLRRQM